MPATQKIITDALNSGDWTATRDGQPVGADDLKIGPNSIDLSLAGQIKEVFALSPNPIDLHNAKSFGTLTDTIPDEGFELQPGRLYLASVRESLDCSAPLWVPTRMREKNAYDGNKYVYSEIEQETYFMPDVDGRSTCGRIGLSIHQTAGRGDYGFKVPFVLELTVILPTRIYRGDYIAQLYAVALTGKPTTRYEGLTTIKTAPLSPDWVLTASSARRCFDAQSRHHPLQARQLERAGCASHLSQPQQVPDVRGGRRWKSAPLLTQLRGTIPTWRKRAQGAQNGPDDPRHARNAKNGRYGGNFAIRGGGVRCLSSLNSGAWCQKVTRRH